MSKDFNFEEIGKRTPFRTPEGFFERMQAETLKRAAEEKRRKKLFRLRVGFSAAMAVAAMICGFVFFPAPDSELPSPENPAEWVAQLNGDAIDLYIQDLTDEELEEWVEFSENDIYYELTTQNSDEDED